MKAAILCLLLAGCSALPPVQAPQIIDNSCAWLPEPSASTQDTEVTKRWMLGYARGYRANCGAAGQ